MISPRLGKLVAYKTETTPARVKLSSNELPFDLPSSLKRDIGREIEGVPLNRYPDPYSEELKGVLSDFFGVPENNILLGNGSDELIYYLSMAVGEFEETVYIPIPTFPMYEISAKALGRPVVGVELERDFDIDIKTSLQKLEESGCVLAFFSYPNNPTANLFSKDRIDKIREKGVFTVIDEAYYHYSSDTFQEEALNRRDTVVLRTLSKIGLAGLRVGIMIAHEDIVREINKLRLPFNITYPSQVIAKLVLTKGREFIDWAVGKVIQERDRLYREMSKIEGVEVFPSEANFLMFRTQPDAGDVHRKLIERGILIRDVGYLPGLKNCLRVSVGREEENDIFLEALSSVMKELL